MRWKRDLGAMEKRLPAGPCFLERCISQGNANYVGTAPREQVSVKETSMVTAAASSIQVAPENLFHGSSRLGGCAVRDALAKSAEMFC